MHINSDKIWLYLKHNKLTQQTFAKMCGISPTFLSKVLNNHRPGIKMLCTIARTMKISFAELIIED